MHFHKPIIIISLIVTFGVIPAAAMRRTIVPGWLFPWPGHFMDKRLRLHDSAVVYAWPSTGGRLELQNPSAFELDVLGIQDHFSECHRSSDPTDEDTFAYKVRRLGGIFFEYQYGRRRGEHQHDEIHSSLGWPEDEEHRGGVWVLKANRKEMSNKMAGRIKLATNMQDRCRAIQMCGGVFHEHPTDEHLVPMQPVPAQERNRSCAHTLDFQD